MVSETRTGVALMPAQSYQIVRASGRSAWWGEAAADGSLPPPLLARQRQWWEGGREGAMVMYEGNNWHDWVIISDGRSVGCSGRLMRWAVRETEIYWSVRCLLKSADREIKHGRSFCLVATRCRGCHSSIHILQTFMSIRNIGIVICVYWEYCLSAPNSYCMSLSPAKRFIVLVLLNLNRYR